MTTLGVIRWDGSNTGVVGLRENSFLSPAQWHNRLPWFGVEVSATSVTNDSNTQAIRDTELLMSWSCGIDYWAFLLYGTEPDLFVAGKGTETGIAGMNNGYKRYKTSTRKSLVKHCLMADGGRCGWSYLPPTTDWSEFADYLVVAMQDADYQKVLSTRPIFYWLDLPSFITVHGGGARTAMDLLRSKAQTAGLGNPYLVSLDGPTAQATTLGMDAISDYALYGTQVSNIEYSYATLTTIASNRWASNLVYYGAVVPTLTAGWDFRPRMGTGIYPSEDGPSWWYTQPTPAQLATHVQAGVDWIAANSSGAPAATLLMYAMNELSEGGYAMPTREDAGMRFQNIGRQLKRQRDPAWTLAARGLPITSR